MDRILETWFEENKRDFPWRINRTPYRVWISEVMLQQTRASVVVPYFLRWMELFPDVKALYMASVEQVIKAWEGLGYYSRARNLHAAARVIVERFGGKIPASEEELLSIKGFGPYTVGAILSFAFQQKAPAVDGNVIRVISRYYCIEEDIKKSATRKKITEKTKDFLDSQMPWVTSEALIELGATICTPKPQCDLCPLQKTCSGKKRAAYLPIKTKNAALTILNRTVFIFENDGYVLVRKGEEGRVMADLYEFPYLEEEYSLGKPFVKLAFCTHTFTRFKANLFPYYVQVPRFESKGEWVQISRLKELPFSSGHRKILTELIRFVVPFATNNTNRKRYSHF